MLNDCMQLLIAACVRMLPCVCMLGMLGNMSSVTYILAVV